MGISCALVCGAVAGAAIRASVPVDGRLRGQDFAASVTSVSWPEEAALDGRAVDATPGHRFVVFGLTVSVNPGAIPTSGTIAINAAVTSGSQSQPLNLSGLDDQIVQASADSGWPSGSQRFTLEVPNTTHDVDLVLSEGSFSQSFDLWTLTRQAPAPSVLYRDATIPTVAAASTGTGTLALSDPADGFSDTAAVSVQSATLGEFPPIGAGAAAPDPDQAVLSVVLDAEAPNNPDDETASGHYLGAQSPLPGSLLTFTPAGGTAVSATMSNAGDNTGKGSSDDGLFDAEYFFVVPATLTTGTLSVDAGSFTGTEFTLYTAEQGNTTLDIASPLTLALGFPALSEDPHQPTPSWVRAPLPPTASASGPLTATAHSSSGSHGFPVWVAVVVLALVALGGLLFERRRRGTRFATATATSPSVVSDPAPPPASSVSLGVTGPEETGVIGPEATTRSNGIEDTGTRSAVRIGSAAAVATEMSRADAPVSNQAALNVLGAREVVAVDIESGWALLIELFTYLVFHQHRHLKAAQIAIGLCSGSSRELDEKTVRNAITRLRRCVGPERLPEAGTEGYLIEGIGSDWFAFERFSRQADTTGGEDALCLRKEALALVRGAPFADVNDEWIDAERLRSHMTVAIVHCAVRLATDLLDALRPLEAEEAASAGLRGAPRHYVLWELGAWAVCDRSDRARLELWMADAKASLDDEDYARLERSVADHLGPSTS
jgi:hypothetical protein